MSESITRPLVYRGKILKSAEARGWIKAQAEGWDGKDRIFFFNHRTIVFDALAFEFFILLYVLYLCGGQFFSYPKQAGRLLQ